MRDNGSNGDEDAPVEASGREIGALADAPVTEDTSVLRAVPDLRGARVEDASGIGIGELYGALAEAETGLVRYLDLSLDTLDRHVLVPIGHARVDEGLLDQPRVRLRAAMLEQLEQIPPFEPDSSHVDDPFERELLDAYGRTFHGERYYAHPAFDHSGVYAGEHQIVSDAEQTELPDLGRMAYLAGWEFVSGEPDIRGWPVVLAGDGTRLEVVDLVVDTSRSQVRYAVVPTPDGTGARLVPIGFLRVNAQAGEVVAEGFTAEDVKGLPAYAGGGITRDMEEMVNAELRRMFTGSRRYLLADFRS